MKITLEFVPKLEHKNLIKCKDTLCSLYINKMLRSIIILKAKRHTKRITDEDT